MSTAPTISIPYDGSFRLTPRSWAVTAGRSLAVALLGSVIFLPEFARDGTGNTGITAYTKILGGFRYIDLDTPMLLADDPFTGGYEQRGGIYDVSGVKSGLGIERK